MNKELPLWSSTDLDGHVSLIKNWYVLIMWEVCWSLLKSSEFPTFPCSRHQFAAGNIFFLAVSRSLIAPFCFYYKMSGHVKRDYRLWLVRSTEKDMRAKLSQAWRTGLGLPIIIMTENLIFTIKIWIADLMLAALLDTSSVRSLLESNIFFDFNRVIQNCGYWLVKLSVEGLRINRYWC
jgi:hypothetical protein